MTGEELIYNKNVIEFITVAKEYAGLVEKSRSIPREKFMQAGLRLIPLLYLKTIMLPDIEEPDFYYTEKFVDENSWTHVQNSVAVCLADFDEYVEVQDDNISRSVDYLNMSLSEIYADVYQDIGDVLGAYQLLDDDIFTPALYLCKSNFSAFWGTRLLTLLSHLHRICFNKEEIL